MINLAFMIVPIIATLTGGLLFLWIAVGMFCETLDEKNDAFLRVAFCLVAVLMTVMGALLFGAGVESFAVLL